MMQELQKILEKNNFSAEESEQLFSFLMKLTPPERQTLFLTLRGFPEYLPIFKDIFAAKLAFIKEPTKARLADILSGEQKMLAKIISEEL